MNGPSRQATFGRGRHADDRLAVEISGVSETDGQQAARSQLATGGQRRGETRPLELAEVVQPGELATATPVELPERSVERRLRCDGDDQNVGSDVPRLICDDTKLHGPVPPGMT